MRIKWFFLFLPIILWGATTETPQEECRKEIQLIDKEISTLEVQKQKHQDLARQYQKQGDQWQYSTGNIQDGYAAWAKADDEQSKAIAIQHQIDMLNQRKQLIIQFYPELWQP